MKPKKFPCPYCKGQGEILEDRADAYMPVNRYEDCLICDKQGMIVVGSRQHKRLNPMYVGKMK